MTPAPQLAATPLAELCVVAGLRLRKQPEGEANFAAVLPIIRVLLEMRRANLLVALWVDDLQLRVQYTGSREREKMTWQTAERLATAFMARKPPQREGREMLAREG